MSPAQRRRAFFVCANVATGAQSQLLGGAGGRADDVPLSDEGSLQHQTCGFSPGAGAMPRDTVTAETFATAVASVLVGELKPVANGLADLRLVHKREQADVRSSLDRLSWRLDKLTAPTPSPEPGRKFVLQAMRAAFAGIPDGSSVTYDQQRALRTLDDLLTRAGMAAATTTTVSWALELADTTVGSFLLSIAGQSAYAALVARTPPLTLDRSARVRVVVGGEMEAAFVAENTPIGLTRSTLSALSLTPKKIVALVSFSGELTESVRNLETTLRRLLSEAVATALDLAFFSADAASPAAPAGVLAGLTAVAPAPPGSSMADDFQALVQALDHPSDPVFIVSPARLVKISASISPSFAYPIIASSAVPDDRVVAIDAGALAAMHGAEPEFSSSMQTTLHHADQDQVEPLIATGPALAVPTRNLWQEDLIALKAKLGVTWGIRPGGAALVDGITW
jgi:hypothetical protein